MITNILSSSVHISKVCVTIFRQRRISVDGHYTNNVNFGSNSSLCFYKPTIKSYKISRVFSFQVYYRFGVFITSYLHIISILPIKVVSQQLYGLYIWHRLKDLNLYKQFWRLLCYHYIKPAYRTLNNGLSISELVQTYKSLNGLRRYTYLNLIFSTLYLVS